MSQSGEKEEVTLNFCTDLSIVTSIECHPLIPEVFEK